MSGLNPRQSKFVEHFLESNNQTQAAIAAGYAPKTAHSTASRMLKNEKVVAELAKRRQRLAKRTDWNVEKLIRKFERIHEKASGEAIESKLREGEKIDPTEVALDYPAALRALENIGKLIGAYVSKHEVEVRKPIPQAVPTQSFPFDLTKLPSNERVEILERLESAQVLEGEFVELGPG